MSAKLANALGIYLDGIRDGNPRRAMATYTGDRYTQHSTGIADGPDGFIEFFEGFVVRNPQRGIRILRTIVDGSHVFFHVYQDLGDARWVTMDLFDTDANDRVIEHWDVIEAYEAKPDSVASQIDGWTGLDGRALDLELTASNKALVSRFVDEVLVGGRVDRLGEFVSEESYVEHHGDFENGLKNDLDSGFDALAAFLDNASATTEYEAPFRLVGEGNLVATYCRVSREGAGHAVFDLFRIDGGKIVEHWDSSEPIPDGPQPNSGKF